MKYKIITFNFREGCLGIKYFEQKHFLLELTIIATLTYHKKVAH